MVRLHLLGFTHDLKGVVFSQRKGGKTASFWVPIDRDFMRAIEKLERARLDRSGRKGTGRSRDVVDMDALPSGKGRLPPVGRSQARSGMPASEIQQLLRQGRTPKNIAEAANTSLAWVERLAEPVLTERIGIVRLAQRAYMHRPRLGVAGMQLGDAVRLNLEDRRTAADPIDNDAAWDARAFASGSWRVWVRFSHRGKRRTAEWEFKKGSRQIVPRNRLAAQVGWWEPDAPPGSVEESTGAEEDGASEPVEAEKKPVRRKAKRRPPAKRRPAPKKQGRAPARKSAKKKPAKRRPAARKRR